MNVRFTLQNETARAYIDALGFSKTCQPDQPYAFASQHAKDAWFFVVVSPATERNRVTFYTEATVDDMRELMTSFWKLPKSLLDFKPAFPAGLDHPGRN